MESCGLAFLKLPAVPLGPLTCAHAFGELPGLQEEPQIAAFLTLHSCHSVAGHRSYNWSTGGRCVGDLSLCTFWKGTWHKLFLGKQAGPRSGFYWKHTNTVESLAMDAFQGLGTRRGVLTGRHQEAPLHRVWKLPLNEHLQAKSHTSACQEPSKVLVRVPATPANLAPPAGQTGWDRRLHFFSF